jgi:cytochrome bd-type quinol oxidase subunit 2
MIKQFRQSIRPMSIVFIILTAIILGARQFLTRKGFNTDVLLMGNVVIYVATIIALWIMVKGANSSNPQAAVRSMYGHFMLRFFLLAIVAFVYIMVAKRNVNKPALIACAALYFIYSYLEIAALLKLLKSKKNA